MGLYISLFKLTEEGIKNIKNSPNRIEEGIKVAEAMGGKVIGFYPTMGEYDYVGIAEWPNDEAASAFLLALGSKGNVRTTTLKAYTIEEFKGIVNKLP
jgi:uncharacterized protein with GYD domain